MNDVHPLTAGLIDFLNASPTPFHAVAQVAKVLQGRGFKRIHLAEPGQPLKPGTKGFVAESGSIFAFHVGSAPVEDAGFRIIAAHTDSPNLRIKPQPLVRSHGYVRLGVEVYGGVQIPTWVDRDLGMAGFVHVRDASAASGFRTELVDIRRPLCRIPTLAIHLNREVNSEGLKVNAQTELPAILSLDRGNDDDPLRALLAEQLEVDSAQILTWDLHLFDLTPACIAGAHNEFVHSGRLDNLASSHAGLEALLSSLDAEPPQATSVLALFDHEEIGSQSSRGANSRAIENVLQGVVGNGSMTRALGNSWLVSADMAHAVHPAYASKHDPEHMPQLNKGPVVKQHVGQRYSTEGETSARWMLMCEAAEVPMQWYVHRTDLQCGSTVGPMLSARLGVRSIDVGNPMLSMHSAREQCGAKDHPMMVTAMTAFFGSS